MSRDDEMSLDPSSVLGAWPALQGGRPPLEEELRVERGVWGKAPGQRTDFRWLAKTAGFPNLSFERELAVGVEDRPARFTLWRRSNSDPSLYLAVSAYPSKAADATGRSGFVEKQVLVWRRPDDVPAALGALLFLPWISSYWAPKVWWPNRNDERLEDPEFSLPLSSSAVELPDDLGLARLDERIDEALQAARRRLERNLAPVYAGWLTGQKAQTLEELQEPLAPAELAALLLPLPRELADESCIAGWVPSSRVAPDLAANWHVLAGAAGEGQPDQTTSLTPEELKMGDALESLLFEGPDAVADGDPAQPVAVDSSAPTKAEEAGIVVWGPSGSGKTMLLAQLYLSHRDEDWLIQINDVNVAGYIRDMRLRMRSQSRFPQVTVLGTKERVAFDVTHRASGRSVQLWMEDRAGKDYSERDDTVMSQLQDASGLVLLFDPERDAAELEFDIANTLDHLDVLSQRGGRLETRPVAVCLSKADLLMKSVDDIAFARNDPDGFVHDRFRHVELLTGLLKNHIERYRLFPISAVGVRPRYGVLEPAVFVDEAFEPRLLRDGEAVNLLEPFAWLLGEVLGLEEASL